MGRDPRTAIVSDRLHWLAYALHAGGGDDGGDGDGRGAYKAMPTYMDRGRKKE